MRSEVRRWAAIWLVAALGVAACSDGRVSTPAAEPSTLVPASSTQPPSTTTGEPATTLQGPVAGPAPTTSMLPARPGGSLETVVLDVAGQERTYRLYLPPQSAGGDPAPLVVDLHGFTSNPDDHDRSSEMRALADVAGFVAAQPSARGAIPTWNPQPGEAGSDADVAFIRALVADVGARVAIDPARVFASGFSNGGGMVHRLACDAADVFAAVGTVSGQYPLVEDCDPSEPIALISFHGTDDLVVPITGVRRIFPDVTAWAARWAGRNGCAPVPARSRVAGDVVVDNWTACDGDVEVAFYTIEGGGHAWPGSTTAGFFAATSNLSASQEMWAFFSEHGRS